MSNDEKAHVIQSLDHLLHSVEAAIMSDDIYAELEKTCDLARAAAEAGDIAEARRLFVFARDLLEEENNVSGTE